MSKAKDKDKPVRFEEAIEKLEAIISDIESGQVGLEECIEQYEQGVKLITRCREVLDKAQTRITELTADAQGRLKAGAATDDADSSDDADSADDDETEAGDR
ncbi:MAG: exodeoxyribonuclease VII small subunit [Planctomycetes bacterium]|nr:exodeoxyribonuclease VII small subunit [Planctomycetota bacterium]